MTLRRWLLICIFASMGLFSVTKMWLNISDWADKFYITFIMISELGYTYISYKEN